MIEDAQGNLVAENEDIEKEFYGYFAKLFSTSSPFQDQIENALRGIVPNISV